MAQMKPKSVAVFNSNDIYPISADSTMPFAQHRDIFYLRCRSRGKHSITFPDAPYEHQRNFILKETNEHIAV
jgi:Xaa-Pro aminopeptidase